MKRADPLSSPLGRAAGRTPPNPDDLRAMRRAVWRDQGVVVLAPDDVTDPWIRQALVNEAERHYGPRAASGLADAASRGRS